MSVASSRSGGVRDPAVRSGLARLWVQVTTWLLAYLPARSRSHRPPVRIHTAPAVFGGVLRLAVVAIGLVCAWQVVTGVPGWVVVIGLLIGLCCAPGTLVGAALVIVFGLLMVFEPVSATGWRTPLLVAAVPLMMQLAAIAGQASVGARIELRVLTLPLRRYLVIQVFAQLLALAGAMVAGLGYVLPQMMALAAVAVLALVALWMPSLGPVRRP